VRETTDAMHPTHPRRRPWPTVLLLVVTALLLALFTVVLIAPPAGAHSLGGGEPSNYRTRVLAVRPPVAGVSVEVVDEVRWVPVPSPLPWLAGAALLAMAVVAAGRTRRWSDALVAALALVVALDLFQVAGTWAAAAAGWVMAGLATERRHRTHVGWDRTGEEADEDWVPAHLHPPVDSRGYHIRPSATLPHRGTDRPGVRFQAARNAERPRAGFQRAREPAAAGSRLATVLPWPGPRRSATFDDPDLPGGA
jgi:hypothetical protein